jgi:membrane-bound serine protease (ClpP class)
MGPVGSIPMRSRHPFPHLAAGSRAAPSYTPIVLSLTLLAALVLPQAPAGPAPAAAPPAPVVTVQLQGPLDASWASILRRAELAVREQGARGFVLVLDTPGGEVELMKRLGDQLDAIADSAETLCLVDRRALSAGSYLAMGCDQIWMVPAATIGAATPISIGPAGVPIELDEDIKEKNLSYFRAEFRAWAEQHGRDPGLAEAFVDNRIELQRVSVRGEPRIVNREEYDELLAQGERPSFLEMVCPAGELLALTTQEALELGFCDGVAEDLDTLLAARGWGDAPRVVVAANWSERLVQGIGSWSWLLLLAAAFFIVISMQMPGLGAPEAAALVCVLVFLFHGYLVGLAEWTEFLFVLAGLALLAVELLLTPGLLVPGIAGGLLLLVGLVLAMQDFVLPTGAIESLVLRDNLLRVLLLVLAAPLLGMTVVRRLLRTRAASFLATAPSADFAGSVGGGAHASVATGARGRCLTSLRPAGRVEVEGEPYDAVSEGGFLEAGRAVRVTGRRGASLVVAPEAEAPA